jgi:hypothetical protein
MRCLISGGRILSLASSWFQSLLKKAWKACAVIPAATEFALGFAGAVRKVRAFFVVICVVGIPDDFAGPSGARDLLFSVYGHPRRRVPSSLSSFCFCLLVSDF